jgi:hypothetical protein
MSTRKLSEINFEDGVVIAGNRVDKFLDDTVNRFNLLPPVDDKSSWVQNQAIFGYTERRSDFVCGPLHPGPGYVVREPPFMPTSKSGIAIPENAIRLKGVNSKDTGINIQVSNGGKYCTEGFIWQVSTWIDQPIVITGLDMWFQTDSSFGTTDFPYPNEWTWAANGPIDTILSGNYVEDFMVQLEVDSPLNAGNADTTSPELVKSQFYADAQWSSFSTAWTTDMLPSLDSQRAFGVAVSCKDINIPISAKSRVRVNIFIPDWSTSSELNAGDVRWFTDPNAPWRLQQYNGALTWVERKI